MPSQPNHPPIPNSKEIQIPPPLAETVLTPLPPSSESTSKSQETSPFLMSWGMPSEQELLGKIIGNCQILKKLGQGGMGAVYLAKHLGLQTHVALKLLLFGTGMTPQIIERFFWEAKTIAKINHPNVVRVFDVGKSPPFYYFIMQFVEGTNLQALIDQGAIDWKKALLFIRSAAYGLKTAHEKGIIHRDIKPANLLISSENELKIADFGLARVQDRENSFSFTGQLLGTPYFMSPEQCEGSEIDTRSDIYSLGVSFYYAITGQHPFTGDTVLAIIHKQLTETPRSILEINPQFPESLQDFVTRMMAKKKEARYATMQEVIQDIDCLLENRPLIWKIPELQTKLLAEKPLPKFKHSRPIIWVSVILGLLGFGILAKTMFSGNESTLKLPQVPQVAYDRALDYTRQHPEKIREVLEHWEEANTTNQEESRQEKIRQEVRSYLEQIVQDKQTRWKNALQSPEYQGFLNRMNFTEGLKWLKSQGNVDLQNIHSFSGLIQIEVQEILVPFLSNAQILLENLQLAEKRFSETTFPLLTEEEPVFKRLLEEQAFYQKYGFPTKLLEEKYQRIQQLIQEKITTLLTLQDFCGAWDLGKEKDLSEDVFQRIRTHFHSNFSQVLEKYSEKELSNQIIEWERRTLLSPELKALCQSKLFPPDASDPISLSDPPIETEPEKEDPTTDPKNPENPEVIPETTHKRFREFFSLCISRHYEEAEQLVSQRLNLSTEESERTLWQDFEKIILHLKQFQEEWVLLLIALSKKEATLFSGLKPEEERFLKSIKKKKLLPTDAEELFKRMDPQLCLKKIELEPSKEKEPSDSLLLGLGYFALFSGLLPPELWREKIDLLLQTSPLPLKILEEPLETFRKNYQTIARYTPFSLDKEVSSFLMIENVFAHEETIKEHWNFPKNASHLGNLNRLEDTSGIGLTWKMEDPPIFWKKQIINFFGLDFAVLPAHFRLQFLIKTEQQFLVKLNALPEQYTLFWSEGEFHLERCKMEYFKRLGEPLPLFVNNYEDHTSSEKQNLGIVPFSLLPETSYEVIVEVFENELRIHLACQERQYTLFQIKTESDFHLHFLSFGGSSPLEISQFQIFQLHQKSMKDAFLEDCKKFSTKQKFSLQDLRLSKWFKEKKKEGDFPWEMKDKKLQSKKDLFPKKSSVDNIEIGLPVPFEPEKSLEIQEFFLETQIQDPKNSSIQINWEIPHQEHPEKEWSGSGYIYWGGETLYVAINGHLVFVRNQLNKIASKNSWSLFFSKSALHLVLNNDFYLMLPFSDLELEPYKPSVNFYWTFQVPVQIHQLQIFSITPQKK